MDRAPRPTTRARANSLIHAAISHAPACSAVSVLQEITAGLLTQASKRPSTPMAAGLLARRRSRFQPDHQLLTTRDLHRPSRRKRLHRPPISPLALPPRRDGGISCTPCGIARQGAVERSLLGVRCNGVISPQSVDGVGGTVASRRAAAPARLSEHLRGRGGPSRIAVPVEEGKA